MPKPLPKSVESVSDSILDVANFVYQHPELGSEEFQSVEHIVQVLKRHGFSVEIPFLGMDTAFVTQPFGSGKHVLVMSEYDALPIGHACGHNLIGAWGVGVALALHADNEFKGKITLVGTPAEEGHGPYASSKEVIGPEMKRRGVETVFAVHPDHEWSVGGKRYAIVRHSFVFSGKEAHPAISPETGVNAVDAAVEFYVSLKMLRSLVRRDEDVIIAPVITDGGKAPNIIPGRSEVLVDVRCISAPYINELITQVTLRAEMAASITGCMVERARVNPICQPAARYPELDSIYYKHAKNYVDLDDPDITWNRPPIASTDYGNISQILPSTHLCMKISPTGIQPHMLKFKEYADPATAGDALLTAVAIACDAIKEHVSSGK